MAGVGEALGRLDAFFDGMPSPQSAVDIFAGQWASILPPPFEELTGGYAGLFDDARIRWGADRLGPFGGMTAVELGPLEGGHSYMLAQMGVASLTAVEGNRSAFLRCLIAKEILGMERVSFLCGDFDLFLDDRAATAAPRYDLCLAVGVLYHQRDPVALLERVARTSERVLLWTHYHDDSIAGRPEVAEKFVGSEEATTAGFPHVRHLYRYGEGRARAGFCGGMWPEASWLSRADILAALEHLGLAVVDVGFDTHDHPNGPCFCVAAARGGTPASSAVP